MTPDDSPVGIKFFTRMGYGRPEAEVWMSKIIQRTRKAKIRSTLFTRVAVSDTLEGIERHRFAGAAGNEAVKPRISPTVMLAKAGIQKSLKFLDSGSR